MNRAPSRLAWSLWAAYAAATVTFLFLGSLNGEADPIATLPILFGFTAFATIGALLIARYRGHPIGWICMTIGLGTALGNLTQQYAIYDLFTREAAPLPGGVASAWLGGWLWVASVGVFVFLPLLLPTGRLSGPRWRSVAWAAGVALVAIVTVFVFKPGPLDIGKAYPVANPLGLAGRGQLLDDIQSMAGIVYVVILIIATLGLVVRARRSRGEERQQLKWIGYAATFMALVLFAVQPLVEALGPRAYADAIGSILFGLAVAALPTGTGIAILKYRLYDIDIIINRTLVYGGLTALLALVYVGGVVGVGGILRDVTGEERNNLVVAASTLAVAALFRPARSRIQTFIDRRFYRSKYDAVRTLEAFSERLRQEVDLDALSGELVGVVNNTMHPAHVSLWLRAPTAGQSEAAP